MDVDERKSRGVNPGGHLDDSNTQLLCRCHHRWRTEHPREARERGLRRASWDEAPRARVACLGTLGRMCSAVEIEGQRYGSIEQLTEAFPDIPAVVIDQALADDDAESGEPWPINACFCVADPEPILTAIGYRWADDPITGDWIAIP